MPEEKKAKGRKLVWDDPEGFSASVDIFGNAPPIRVREDFRGKADVSKTKYGTRSDETDSRPAPKQDTK